MTLHLLDWRDMVEHAFFSPCPVHAAAHSARDCLINQWSLTTGTPACSLCVASRPSELYIQVRRSSYHDVVKMADISRFADIGGIQGYTINSSKVIFLRRRPQPRPPKGAVGASVCTVCTRHLQDVSHFCSMQCKLDGMAGVRHVSLRQESPLDAAVVLTSGGCNSHTHTHGAVHGSAAHHHAAVLGALATAPPPCAIATGRGGAAHSSGSSSRSGGSGGGPETPLYPASLRGLDAVISSDSEYMADFIGHPAKRRKGCPLRAPSV